LLGGEDWMSGLAFGTDRRTAFFTRNGDIWRLDLAPKPVDYQQQDHWKEILAGDDKEDKPGKPGAPSPTRQSRKNMASSSISTASKTGSSTSSPSRAAASSCTL
jgi:hypothetical protein